jgi:sulfur carrier protein
MAGNPPPRNSAYAKREGSFQFPVAGAPDSVKLETGNWKLYLRAMRLLINGEPRDFDGDLTLSTLVERLGMTAGRVAIELNREIVPRGEWDSTALHEGDRLEMVHFVGGG